HRSVHAACPTARRGPYGQTIEPLTPPVNNPPGDDLTAVEGPAPRHLLFGRRLARLSTRSRPHHVGALFVTDRDTRGRRLPPVATRLVTPPLPEPRCGLSPHQARGSALPPPPTLAPTRPPVAPPRCRRPR